MIGNYPITWLITELVSVVLFTLCMFHALKQEQPKQALFELLCFVIGSGIFENIGVATDQYRYDLHRILLVGLVPLSTLLIEAAIFYAAFRLFKYLNMPTWTSIWVVGLFCTFQDMSIDPVYVYDTYNYNGVMSGQWNWTSIINNVYQSQCFFGIPYFNFSGWLYMMGIYAFLLLSFRKKLEKKENETLRTIYPFLCGIILPISLCVIGYPLELGFPFGTSATVELIKLVISISFPIVLMIVYRKKMLTIDLKKDSIIFIVPIVLHIYDLAVGFGIGIIQSYVPITITAIIHAVYLGWLYKTSVKTTYQANKKLN